MNSAEPIMSLLEMTMLIKKTLQTGLNKRVWVKAEINKINVYKASGHAFLELVEKRNGQMLAQLRAVIWKNDYQAISSVFQKTTGKNLGDGMSVLCEAEILYDPVYGLSMRITRIDPSYSLGEMEREKQECILRLKKEGLFDLNRIIVKPLLIQRIAIISVENSKGFSDFREKIDNNPWGYAFYYQLFPALLQGDQAIPSIIRQLNRIEKVRQHFDAVAIIRGGGDDAGLSCYNSYELAGRVARLSLPMLSGIGHSTNETVVEMIAAVNAITPTDLADYLLQRFHNIAVPLKNARQTIISQSSKLLEITKKEFRSAQKIMNNIAKTKIINEETALEQFSSDLARASRSMLRHAREGLKNAATNLSISHSRIINQVAMDIQKALLKLEGNSHNQLTHANIILRQIHKNTETTSNLRIEKNIQKLEYLHKSVDLLDPQKVLNRGFSITRCEGEIITDPHKIKEGRLLNTQLKNGEITSVVHKIK